MPQDAAEPTPQPAFGRVFEWLLVGLLLGNLSWSTLCLGAYRPATQVVTYGLTAALLGLLLLFRAVRSPTQGGAWDRRMLFLWLFLACGACNALFLSPVPWLGWLDLFGWAQWIGIFWAVRTGFERPGLRRTLYGALMVLSLASVALAFYQRFSDPAWLMLGRRQLEQYEGRASGPFGIPNSLAGLLVLVLPSIAALALDRGRGLTLRLAAAYAAVCLLAGLLLTVSRGGWLALLLALSAAPFLYSGVPVWKRGLRSLAVLGAGALAALLLYVSVSDVRKRIDALAADGGERTRPVLWSAAWKIFEEHPVAGGGAGSYNTRFELYRPEDCQREPQWAHNEYLNTLADYGTVGFALVAVGLGGLFFAGWRRDYAGVSRPEFGDEALPPSVKRGLVLGLLAFGLQALLDFHMKIPALALTFAVAAGLAFPRRAEAGQAKGKPDLAVRWRRLALLGAALGGAALFAFFAYPLLKAETLRYEARERLDLLALKGADAEREARVLGECETMLQEAVRRCPAHGYAWADLSYVRSLQSRLAPAATMKLGAEAEAAARQALTRSREVPEFWIRLGVSLDMQGRWLDAGEAFTEAQRLAPASANLFYYLAFHYSLRKTTEDSARSLVATCLRLDPSHGPAQLLRNRLAQDTSHR